MIERRPSEYILYHRKRQAMQTAAEPYIKAICALMATASPILIVQPDGSVECKYPEDVERTWAKLRENCDRAVEHAARLVDRGF